MHVLPDFRVPLVLLFDVQVATTADNVLIFKGLTSHTAAATGDLQVLIAIEAKDPALLKAKDHNGWTPLHEAVRGGHLDCVKFLIQHGLDKVSSVHYSVFFVVIDFNRP